MKFKSQNEMSVTLKRGQEEVTTQQQPTKLEPFGARHTLALMGLLGITISYTLRVNLSVAIVSMVNNTDSRNNSGEDPDTCPYPDDYPQSSANSAGEFDWGAKTQGLVLGSFFYGYALTQVIGGRAAEYLGGRLVMGVSVVGTSLLSLASPLAARTSTSLFVALRILEGCFQGVSFPSMNSMVTRWYPKEERSKFASTIFSGTHLGPVIAMIISGWLCASNFLGGWPSVFYLFGLVGLIWGIFWFWLIRDNPRNHPRISSAERDYILKGCPERESSVPVPWLSIFTSRSFYVILIMHFGNSWGFYMLLTELPTYLDQILHVNITNNGLFSAMPYLGAWLFSIAFSMSMDRLIATGVLSIRSVRRLAMIVGGYGPMLGLIAMCFVKCHLVLAFAILIISGASNGAVFCGYMCSHSDISPRFAGTLMGMTNTLATTSGFITPAVTGALTENNQTFQAWRNVFLTAILIYLVTVAVYVAFISTEIEPWNDPPATSALESGKGDKKEDQNRSSWRLPTQVSQK